MRTGRCSETLDRSRADFDRAVEELEISWPQVWDGMGEQTEAALRYAVDGPPRTLLIGKDGRIAALHLYPVDEHGVNEVEVAIRAALEANE